MNQRKLESMGQYLKDQFEGNEVSGYYSWHAKAERDNLSRFVKSVAEMGVSVNSLLDVGCRNGRVLGAAEEILGTDGRIVGVDITPEFVGNCEDQGFEVHCADMHEMPFKDQEFDLTYCFHALEHAYDVGKAIKELARVTRGALFVGVPLQGAEIFEANKSHYARCETALDWLRQFDLPGWDLYESFFNKTATAVTEYVNFTFVRFKR